MPDVTNEVVFSVSDGDNAGTVMFGVEAGSVMRVNIDDTLSVSGEAADAYATGQAIASKATTSDIQQLLNVNGKTAGAGNWAIIVNGDNIPAQSDSDTESVAEALERLEGVGTGLSSDLGTEEQTRSAADDALQDAIDAEETARQAADTALDTRVAILESRVGLYLDVTNITYSGLIGQTHTVEDSRITTNWFLAGVQFFTGNTTSSYATATGEVLADLRIETGAGYVDVTVGDDYVSGCSARILLMSAGWAGGV